MKIFVGNMSKETSEQQLRDSFEKFGEVTSANILLDKESGKSTGFAFVDMPSDDEAHTAITGINIRALAGRPLERNKAKKE